MEFQPTPEMIEELQNHKPTEITSEEEEVIKRAFKELNPYGFNITFGPKS